MRHSGYEHWWMAMAVAGIAVPAASAQSQEPAPAIDEIERLRAQLAQPGPENADAREVAAERLAARVDERAHVVLCQRLAAADDPDEVRSLILRTLARRLLNPVDDVFGQRDETEALRGRIVRLYAHTLCSYWQGEADADGLLPIESLREDARICLVRMPPRQLLEALRGIAASGEQPLLMRVAALRVAGDLQNLLYGRVLADFLDSGEMALQRAARAALRYLTFAEPAIETKEQFESWFQTHGTRRYLDLAEQAARLGARRARQHREELLVVQRLAASEIVRAMTERRTGVDWSNVQQRTLVDDVGTVRACLQQLQRTLAEVVHGDDAAPRLGFARALLQRYRAANGDSAQPRSLMLEVLAYLVRTNEDLAGEVVAELMTQLDGADGELRLAALRGLRRFPSPEARGAIVRLAQAAMQPDGSEVLLAQALQTLGSTAEPSWRAPTETSPDRAAWLDLVRAVCTGNLPRERRSEGLAIALLTDREGKRVGEVFDMLVAIAGDPAREPEYRTQCLIQMQAWRDGPGRADMIVSLQTQLLADPERDVRLFAADALTRLPEGSEEQKKNWIGRVIAALRERLPVENNASVLRGMLDCLLAVSNGPVPPGAAIGALNVVLDGVPVPVPPDQEPRADALLRALTTIAAAPLADQGQWVGACEMLLRHERRRMLRHVLESHNAVLLAKEVRNSDTTVAQRARSAMRYLLLTALLKSPKEAWASSAELKSEANDVRIAFEALPPNERLPESLQEPRLRLLRLDVLVACGKSQEAIALGNAWLEDKEQRDGALSAGQQDLVRVLVAEAHMLEAKTELAAQSLARIGSLAAEPRAVELADRIGRAFLADNVGKAVEWLDRAVRATAEDDPAFRSRLVATWQAKLKASPADRAAVVAEIDQRAALFDVPDCPEDLKEAVGVLLGRQKPSK